MLILKPIIAILLLLSDDITSVKSEVPNPDDESRKGQSPALRSTTQGTSEDTGIIHIKTESPNLNESASPIASSTAFNLDRSASVLGQSATLTSLGNEATDETDFGRDASDEDMDEEGGAEENGYLYFLTAEEQLGMCV